MLDALVKTVKIGTALNARGLHWKIEPVSLYHVLNCFRYGPVLFLSLYVRRGIADAQEKQQQYRR
jgi:hypothetical protein